MPGTKLCTAVWLSVRWYWHFSAKGLPIANAKLAAWHKSASIVNSSGKDEQATYTRLLLEERLIDQANRPTILPNPMMASMLVLVRHSGICGRHSMDENPFRYTGANNWTPCSSAEACSSVEVSATRQDTRTSSLFFAKCTAASLMILLSPPSSDVNPHVWHNIKRCFLSGSCLGGIAVSWSSGEPRSLARGSCRMSQREITVRGRNQRSSITPILIIPYTRARARTYVRDYRIRFGGNIWKRVAIHLTNIQGVEQ